jgi:hypothetical protein
MSAQSEAPVLSHPMARTPGPWDVSAGGGDILRRTEHLALSDVVAAVIFGTLGDAHLLAASPDLLEAAKEAVALLEGAYDDQWGAANRVHELLKGAIGRAEGRR